MQRAKINLKRLLAIKIKAKLFVLFTDGEKVTLKRFYIVFLFILARNTRAGRW